LWFLQDKNGVLDRNELTNVVRDTMQLLDPERAQDEELIAEATDKLFLRSTFVLFWFSDIVS